MEAISQFKNRSASSCGALLRQVARRAELWRRPGPDDVRAPQRRLLLGEVASFAEPLRRHFRQPLDIAPAAIPRVVMLVPGFATHPRRMRYMATQLERAGHKVKRWGQGWNTGPSEDCLAMLEKRLGQIYRRYGQEVVLVGWSLGGIFAREVAKRQPQYVARVVTLGAPFSGSPYANNVWRLYELVTGHSVEMPPVSVRVSEKPPVETVAYWSPRDAAISPRCAAGRPGERDRVESLRCSHMGFANSTESIRAVLRELDRP